MSRGISCTIVFEGENLNYGEGIGNITEIKKLNRGDNNVYSYMSRQAKRYCISEMGKDLFDWNLHVVDDSKGVIQFKDGLDISDSTEMDLFGFMKTNKSGASLTRKSCVRLTHSISLEPYKSDMDFLTNKGFADRIGKFPNIANVEQHKSFYTYTVTIDLDRVGIDGDVVLDNEIRAARVIELLEIIKLLKREIKGSTQQLSPVFIVGGLYETCNPFFMGRIKLNNGVNLSTEPLASTLSLTFKDKPVKDFTKIGLVEGVFDNDKEIETLLDDGYMSVESFFDHLKNEVKNYYGV